MFLKILGTRKKKAIFSGVLMTMTKTIDINELKMVYENNKPLYVLMSGGFAVGKTHIAKTFIDYLPIMDLDDVMIEMGFHEYTPKNISYAMREISNRIEQLMKRKDSFIAMGTASNVVFSINRLFNAKMKKYTTALIFVDAPVDQAQKQNKLREARGERFVRPEDTHKIQKTNFDSEGTVAILKHTDLVDYFIHYENKYIVSDRI